MLHNIIIHSIRHALCYLLLVTVQRGLIMITSQNHRLDILTVHTHTHGHFISVEGPTDLASATLVTVNLPLNMENFWAQFSKKKLFIHIQDSNNKKKWSKVCYTK